MSQWPHKDPDDVLDYAVDWAERLAGDTISSASWIVPEGITVDDSSFTGTVATIWLSGGTSGRLYRITSRITTVAGRQMDHAVSLFVRGG